MGFAIDAPTAPALPPARTIAMKDGFFLEELLVSVLSLATFTLCTVAIVSRIGSYAMEESTFLWSY